MPCAQEMYRVSLSLFWDFVYLFEREHERVRGGGRGGGSLPAEQGAQ